MNRTRQDHRPSADTVFDWLDDSARRRERAGLRREMRVRDASAPGINLAGNDYLGLSSHPEVTSAAGEAAVRWGAGSGAARLVTGTTRLHVELERELAAFCGFEAALVFSSGYLANLGVLTALCRPGSLVVADRTNHASLIDGCGLSGAEVVDIPHNDPVTLDETLTAGGRPRALVVTESVFSVDGDLVDLDEVYATCRGHGAALLVDEAHALGVVGERGEGALGAAGLAGRPDTVATVTLSKSLGAQGGAVLGPRRVIEHVLNSARGFLFDTGLAPACAGGALAALRILDREPARVARLRTVATRLHQGLAAAGLPVSPARAAVVSVRAGSARSAVAWREECRAAGVEVGCFRPPSVPDRFSRLRLTARADLSDAEVDRAVQVITEHRPG
ncbi:8-amino-7-oxononanoate synthase [Streptomyces tsukubensis]|uniref:8-amino-7-oxononanoate synthase n=1 Tax=Streptomyces tsukubensis TaxID=83656 RepID=A0A1V4AGV8_9ACTN|nr:8-amino-7-oxononanoate synthase [Streptomyces tsukubensis]OON82915.1 8-amino-7-oxononanoate synthase [Streptomyces tsukubensis]QFR91900.1 aminotransferase class I/II-fold pyridoxal phosphate-dependent enzyme [Streptomyces tsukubensis]